jgi:hypothetical protein
VDSDNWCRCCCDESRARDVDRLRWGCTDDRAHNRWCTCVRNGQSWLIWGVFVDRKALVAGLDECSSCFGFEMTAVDDARLKAIAPED